MFYRKSKLFNLAKIDGIFYISTGLKSYEVNEIGARIFDLCNGENREDDIIEKIAIRFSKTNNEIREDVQQFIAQMFELKIIEKA